MALSYLKSFEDVLPPISVKKLIKSAKTLFSFNQSMYLIYSMPKTIASTFEIVTGDLCISSFVKCIILQYNKA